MTQFEIHFDGACNPINPGGHMGFGYIARQDGDYIFSNSFYEKANDKNSNNVAEYRACLNSLQELKDYIDLQNIQDFEVFMFGDSKLVVMQMKGSWKINSGLYREWALKTKNYIQDHFKNKVSFKWIPREENSEADEMSVRELINNGVKRTY